MRIKELLIGVFMLLAFSTYAQTDKSSIKENGDGVTEFKVELASLDKLKNIDWNIVKELFRENDKSTEITLAVAYLNKSEIHQSKVRVDQVEIKLSGKTSDLDKLTMQLKNSIERLPEFNEKIEKVLD